MQRQDPFTGPDRPPRTKAPVVVVQDPFTGPDRRDEDSAIRAAAELAALKAHAEEAERLAAPTPPEPTRKGGKR